MMLNDFLRIVESKAPQSLHDRVVTPDEAKAVITNYQRLTDPHRSKFLSLPIDNIIEFAMIDKAPTGMPKNGGFKNYMTEVENTHEPEKPALEQHDYLDAPLVEVASEPVAIPVVKPKVARKKARVVEEAPTRIDTASEEVFFTRLLERLNVLSDPKPQPVTVETTVQTTEAHIERLYEIEQSMLDRLNLMSEHVASQSTETQSNLIEVLNIQRALITQISETQSQIVNAQTQMVAAISLLTEKVGVLAQTAPVVNVPAPVVNVTMQEGKRVTKMVERDENGLIKKITEGYEQEAV